MSRDMHLELRYDPPMHGEPKRIALRVPWDTFKEVFAPLPRDRELASISSPLAAYFQSSQRKALEMQANRRKLAHVIAVEMAAKLIELIAKDDPQFGYSPEEWAEIMEEMPR